MKESKYTRWTKDGTYCYKTDSDCDNCRVFRFQGIRKDQGCFQPESNQSLIEAGIVPKGELNGLYQCFKKECDPDAEELGGSDTSDAVCPL